MSVNCRDCVEVFGNVCLPRLMEGKWVTPIFSSYQKLPVPPQAAGVVGSFNCCAFFLYTSGIQTTQHTRSGVVTAVSQTLCKLCRPLPPQVMVARFIYDGPPIRRQLFVGSTLLE